MAGFTKAGETRHIFRLWSMLLGGCGALDSFRMSMSTDLDRYLAETRSFPMLTAEEERDLARRWRDYHDEQAARKLVGSHMRLVVKIARKFSGYGVDLADVIAEGNVGLMQAVEKFDPELGYRFGRWFAWGRPRRRRSCSLTCAG